MLGTGITSYSNQGIFLRDTVISKPGPFQYFEKNVLKREVKLFQVLQ
jgi:hypothetical protein